MQPVKIEALGNNVYSLDMQKAQFVKEYGRDSWVKELNRRMYERIAKVEQRKQPKKRSA